jgi:hypothetical protein
MGGAERAMAYRLASGSGLRVSELKSLTPESFDLKSNPATVRVAAGYSKRRRRDVQPLSSALVALLRPWLASKASGEPVLKLPARTADMVKADLKAARVPYATSAGTLDFHSLRHGYITELVASGASVKTCQELARHSTPTLTIGRYGHTRLADVVGAVEALPVVATAAAQEQAQGLATGTDGKPEGWDLSVYLTGAKQPQAVRDNATSFIPTSDMEQGDTNKKPQQKREIMRHPAKGGNEKGEWRNGRRWGLKIPCENPQTPVNKALTDGQAPAGTYLCTYPAELAPVVQAWDTLPEHLRAAILAIVATVQPPGKGGGR